MYWVVGLKFFGMFSVVLLRLVPKVKKRSSCLVLVVVFGFFCISVLVVLECGLVRIWFGCVLLYVFYIECSIMVLLWTSTRFGVLIFGGSLGII